MTIKKVNADPENIKLSKVYWYKRKLTNTEGYIKLVFHNLGEIEDYEDNGMGWENLYEEVEADDGEDNN